MSRFFFSNSKIRLFGITGTSFLIKYKWHWIYLRFWSADWMMWRKIHWNVDNVEKWQNVRLIVIHRFFSCNNRRIHACWLWQKVIVMALNSIIEIATLHYIHIPIWGLLSHVVDMFKNDASFLEDFFDGCLLLFLQPAMLFWMEIEWETVN